MKKRIFLLGLTLLVSCSSQGTSFDSDFYSKVDKIKDLESSEIVTLKKVEDSLYDYYFEFESISVKAYFTELKSEYSYAFVLTLSYKEKRIEDVRAIVCTINDNNSTIAQIGFDGNKKIIDSYNDSSTFTYKGIQTFITPFNEETSITRFYFECSSYTGGYFELNDIKEIK